MKKDIPRNGCVATLSGGLDSTVALAMARLLCPVPLAITFDYGQRAAEREIEAARIVARHLDVPHKVISLPWMQQLPGALTRRESSVPTVSIADLRNSDTVQNTMRAVWVPNRNAIFLSIAAAEAEALGLNRVCTGFNAEEGATFPDNTPEFLKAVNETFKFSTLNRVQVVSPTLFMTKREIWRQACSFQLPVEKLWSCYEGDESPCGRCESCARIRRAQGESPIRNQEDQASGHSAYS